MLVASTQILTSDTWRYRLLIGFFGLAMLDWILTIFLIKHGATEANPIVAHFLGVSPLAALMFKVAICAPAVLFFSYQWYRKWIRVAVAGLTGIYVMLIGYEILLIAQIGLAYLHIPLLLLSIIACLLLLSLRKVGEVIFAQ